MKKHLLVLVFVLVGAMGYAQAPIDQGEVQLNAGFGFSNGGLPIYAGAEFGIGNNISLGGLLSYRGDKDSYSVAGTGYSWKYRYTTIAAFGNYHFNELLNIPSKFDFYAGVSLGYTIFKAKYDGSGSVSYAGSEGSGFYFSGQVGGRYFFTDRFAVNLEFGGGNYISGGKLGITYKF
ncbi:MAG: outer membrane beta-barrel protein [Bacteroidales bacterium]